MAAYATNANAQTNRNEFSRGRALPGERPSSNAYTHRPVSGVDVTPNVAQVTTVEITASANLDTPALVIDGVSIPFVSSTTDALTAAALKAALDVALLGLLGEKVESAEVDAETVTITFSDYVAHEVSFTAEGSTTATVAEDTAASAEVNHRAGVFVAYATASGDPSVVSCQLPQNASAKLIGVVEAGPYPNHQQPANPYGLAADEAWPAGVQFPIARDGVMCVRLMDDVSVGDPVYVYTAEGPNRGYACADEQLTAGAHQVTRGDVVFNGTDAVGVVVDGYLVSVPSNTSDDQTATDLRNAWNNDAFAASLATASIDLSGTPSYFLLTFLDYAEHIVAAYSPATADVTGITNTTEAEAPAAQAIRFKSATFTETRTAAQGDAYADLG